MLTFYATISYGKTDDNMPDIPWLLPASSWSRGGLPKPKLPPNVRHTAADSGGFVATFKWGDYRYTADEYVAWLDTFKPRWAATMDYCCEPEITGHNDGVVRERQQRTSDMAFEFWRSYRDAEWSWTPTIQGWEVEDYVRHAKELKPLIADFRRVSTSDFRVGIGTLCRRASASMIAQVVTAVSEVLDDAPLHLWGVKLSVLKTRVELPNVASVDSGAWNGLFGRDAEEARAHMRRHGLTQKRYELDVALPRYLAKVEEALSQPKQLVLF